ncbi:MAG: alpha-ketoglutarate-dependent dioxygenase AlkB [Myxococcales bacterium]
MARRSSQRVADPPQGFQYRPDLLSPAEEARLLGELGRVALAAPVLHGTSARRLTAHFGWSYALEDRLLQPALPIPDDLLRLRRHAAELADVDPESLAEVLVTRYPPGAGIGWHRDAPQFGTPVVGVSLASACRLRLRRPRPDSYELHELLLEPRSGYVLRGSARWQWQHSIPAVTAERWSVTFRTLRQPRALVSLPRPSPAPAPGG